MTRTNDGWSRREWLRAAAALPLAGCALDPRGSSSIQQNPFALGLASGDPSPDGFVLWTRLCVDAAAPDCGMPRLAVDVPWTVATDPLLRDVVAEGIAVATPEDAHCVHVEVEGLEPGRVYYYGFRVGPHSTEVGRTRTAPASGTVPGRLDFAVASCQSYEQGLFTAYEAMARDELDLVVFLGDYIYEYGAGVQGKVRTHLGGECTTLADYRRRYAQYKSDPLLRRMHARCPWLVVFDDHEVANNYAGVVPAQRTDNPAAFRVRRATAYRAFYENMPLRRTARPVGDTMRLHRTVQFGDLLSFHLLDTRQYRSDQPNGDGIAAANAASLDPEATMLGAEQREWLFEQLRRSPCRWNALAQQVLVAAIDLNAKPGQPPRFKMDQWPGYAHERALLLRTLRDEEVRNPVVLTGDVHSSWCNELRVDDRDPSAPVVAPEFVATSISSGGDGSTLPKDWARYAASNPFVAFHDRRRGYLRCSVTEDAWRTDYVALDRVETPGGTASVVASFAVHDGDPRVHAAR